MGGKMRARDAQPIRRERIDLPETSPGTRRHLEVWRFGAPGARPKAYFQASLHADELSAMVVAHALAARLEAAARRGGIAGEVVVVPVANPIGLAQFVQGRSLGRFALGGGGNFNRGFADVTDAVAARVADGLGDDAVRNVALVREAMAAIVTELEAVDEVQSLRRTLLGLAADADIALDLHCDSEALMHLYLGTPLWPAAADLSAQIGSYATLLALASGGSPFDEAVGGVWWALAERFPQHPLPPACLSGTVELRGRADVSEALADADADNLVRFLQRRGVVAGDPGPLPPALCDATPLEGVDMVHAPCAGVICYRRDLGARVAAGGERAVMRDPRAPDAARARTALSAT
ncbi:MAG: M14 family metallopeptidase, partial [Gammaproteobacteria bacterium]|nr:M14 family metallopeptidase [Gammaproteobacteria bacterium]